MIMHPNAKVQAVRTQPSALKLMEGRERAPKWGDTTVTTELPDGCKLESFWKECKSRRKCERPPYDRLLINPVLRADYCTTTTTREMPGEGGCSVVEARLGHEDSGVTDQSPISPLWHG